MASIQVLNKAPLRTTLTSTLASTTSDSVQLAQSLPKQLLQLFRRFPPEALRSKAESAAPTHLTFTQRTNPFMPWKNPMTGNWHGPHYSLRRQADLFKLAVHHNVLPLMPRSPKHPEVKEAKRLGLGVTVKGTGVGQKVKGHKWERTLKYKLDARKQAMLGMPQLIKSWRERGSGRGWKKFPRGTKGYTLNEVKRNADPFIEQIRL